MSSKFRAAEPAAGVDLAALEARTERIAADVPYRSSTAAFDFIATKIGRRSFDEVIKTLEALTSTRAVGQIAALKQSEPAALRWCVSVAFGNHLGVARC